jgi:dihydroorotate dehydrogenase (NAD+) catalytic subunit
MTTRDAIEFILAGATAVAVGTATFRNPLAAVEIIQGLAAYCDKTGLPIRKLVGAAHVR